MITDSFEIFCDKYHKRQHLSDDIIKYIMNMNTDSIHLEKLKKEHKKKLIFGYTGINDLCGSVKISQSDYYGTIIEEFYRVRKKEKGWYEDSEYLGKEFNGYFYSNK